MKNKFVFFLPVLPAAGLILLLAGCGQKYPPGMPALYPCKITLTLGGKPASGITVLLHKDGKSSEWATSGMTEQNGTVMVSTNGPYKGVPLGKYKVTVEKLTQENSKTKRGWYRMVDLIDPKYRDVKTTELDIEVTKTARKNVFEFDLGDETFAPVSDWMPPAPVRVFD